MSVPPETGPGRPKPERQPQRRSEWKWQLRMLLLSRRPLPAAASPGAGLRTHPRWPARQVFRFRPALLPPCRREHCCRVLKSSCCRLRTGGEDPGAVPQVRLTQPGARVQPLAQRRRLPVRHRRRSDGEAPASGRPAPQDPQALQQLQDLQPPQALQAPQDSLALQDLQMPHQRRRHRPEPGVAPF